MPLPRERRAPGLLAPSLPRQGNSPGGRGVPGCSPYSPSYSEPQVLTSRLCLRREGEESCALSATRRLSSLCCQRMSALCG